MFAMDGPKVVSEMEAIMEMESPGQDEKRDASRGGIC
jgi:hypothetical protein